MGMVKANPICLHFFFIFTIFSFITKSEGADCYYSIDVKTGDVNNAGTDSLISMTLSDGQTTTPIDNLAGWGHYQGDPFERGNLDNFYGYLTCLPKPVCAITVTSDGTGPKPGWFLDYIEVTACSPTGTDCNRQRYEFGLWLAEDEYPWSLTASRDLCYNYYNRKFAITASDLV